MRLNSPWPVRKMMSPLKSPRSILLLQACILALLMLAANPSYARHHHKQNTDAQSGQFDYYLLSLSWALTYCLTHGEDGAECSNIGYGFVLHGLCLLFNDTGNPE